MQKLGSEPLEATWSGFEVEVENDNGDIRTSEIELVNDTTECVVSDEPEIIVECLDQTPVSSDLNGTEVSSAPGVANNNRLQNQNSARKDNHRAPEKSFRQPCPKRQRFLNDRNNADETKFEAQRHKPTTAGTPLIEIKDEYAAFAVYVQQELKKISNPYGLQMAKLKINQVLFEGTTGYYDKSPQNNSSAQVKASTPNRSQMIITSKMKPYEPTQQKVTGNSDTS